MVAAAAFAVNGLSYGLLRSLGLALPDLAEHFDRSTQDTAWVSALALAVQQAASEGGPEAGGGNRGGLAEMDDPPDDRTPWERAPAGTESQKTEGPEVKGRSS